MPGRDFMDHDLYANRTELPKVKLGPGDEPAPPAGAVLQSGASDLDLPLLARHRQSLDEEAARQAQELERLRRMEVELERQRREIEEARQNHDQFMQGRKELMDRINQSLVMLERQELKATQILEVLQSTRLRFRTLLDELTAIRPEEWTEENLREKIREALVRMDDMRTEFNKAMARVEALTSDTVQPGGASVAMVPPLASRVAEVPPERTLGQWFVIGLMVSLPVMIAAAMVLLILWIRGVL